MNTEENIESEEYRGLSKEQIIQSDTEASLIQSSGKSGIGKGALRMIKLGLKKNYS